MGASPVVTVQVFTKHDALLGGIDEAIAILKLCADDWSALEVRALHDGDAITPWEVVLEITGPYDHFAHLETLYLRRAGSPNPRRHQHAPRGGGSPPQGRDVLPGTA